jgi:hypothetical protein
MAARHFCETIIRYGCLFLIGLTFVWTLTALSQALKYPYGNDATGYIQEAKFWLAGQGLIRTASLSRLPQSFVPTSFFPPGYSLLTAFASLGRLSIDDAALSVTRLSWAVIPVAVVFALAPLIGFVQATLCGVLVTLSPGVVENGYAAGTDVPFLALVAFSMGLLVRGWRAERWLPMTASAGVLAGAAYALRNAGAALFAAVLASYLLAALARLDGLKQIVSRLGVWGLSAGCVVGPLLWRNYVLFGRLQPYDHAGAPFGYLQSVRIFLSGLLTDLTGSKAVAMLAWDFKWLLSGVPVAAWLLYRGLVRFPRTEQRRRFACVLLGSYAAFAGILVIVAQKRYGADGSLRYAMQAVWALLGLAAYALADKKRLLLLVTVLLLASRVAYVNADLQRERTIAKAFSVHARFADAATALPREWILTNRIKYVLAQDDSLRALIRSLPTDAVIVANQDRFLQRLVRDRAIMHLELERVTDGAGFDEVVRVAKARALDRPVYALVVATNRILRDSTAQEWTQLLSRAVNPQFETVAIRDNYVLLKWRRGEPQRGTSSAEPSLEPAHFRAATLTDCGPCNAEVMHEPNTDEGWRSR